MTITNVQRAMFSYTNTMTSCQWLFKMKFETILLYTRRRPNNNTHCRCFSAPNPFVIETYWKTLLFIKFYLIFRSTALLKPYLNNFCLVFKNQIIIGSHDQIKKKIHHTWSHTIFNRSYVYFELPHIDNLRNLCHVRVVINNSSAEMIKVCIHIYIAKIFHCAWLFTTL